MICRCLGVKSETRDESSRAAGILGGDNVARDFYAREPVVS